jgi:hypothetical protein
VAIALAAILKSRYCTPSHVQDIPQIAAHFSQPLLKSQWPTAAQPFFNCLLPTSLFRLRLQGCHTFKFVSSQLRNFSCTFLGTNSHCALRNVPMLYKRTLKTEWENGERGIMADDRVVMRSDCNVSCLVTSGYVTAGNSWLVSGYLCFVGNDTVWLYVCI